VIIDVSRGINRSEAYVRTSNTSVVSIAHQIGKVEMSRSNNGANVVGASVTGAAHWAVTFRAYGALRALLRPHAAAAFASSKAWDRCTPLMLCCRNGDSRALSILLQTAVVHGGSML
jgi:hypothetical protein